MVSGNLIRRKTTTRPPQFCNSGVMHTIQGPSPDLPSPPGLPQLPPGGPLTPLKLFAGVHDILDGATQIEFNRMLCPVVCDTASQSWAVDGKIFEQAPAFGK